MDPAVIARVRDLAAAGHSATEIASTLRRSRGSISGIGYRFGISFTSKAPTVRRGTIRFWTTERIGELRTRARSESAAQIAVSWGKAEQTVRNYAKPLGITFARSRQRASLHHVNIPADPPDPRRRGPRYGAVSLTARLMGDPPPGRTPWAEEAIS